MRQVLIQTVFEYQKWKFLTTGYKNQANVMIRVVFVACKQPRGIFISKEKLDINRPKKRRQQKKKTTQQFTIRILSLLFAEKEKQPFREI